MDMHRKIRCGHLRSPSNLHSMASRPTALTHHNSPRTSNNHLTSHLHNYDTREAIHKCKLCNIQACKDLGKAIRHQVEDYTQIKALSNSCSKQPPPALSLALRVGHHHNNNPALEVIGAGQDNPNDDFHIHVPMITSYENIDGMI